MRYIKGSLNRKLCLGRDDITLHGYCNADWIGNANERGLRVGYVIFVGVGAISWNYKKHLAIPRSTMEVDFLAASHGAIEAIWLMLLLEDVGLV